MNMNNKRAEQVHYIPPGRRKPAVSAAALATVVPPLRSSPKTAIPPLPSLYQPTTTSTSRPAVDSPTLNHVQPAPRFEPSTTPPIRATETMRSSQTTPHGRIQPQRRDSYEVGVTPAMAPGSVHHSRDPVRLEVHLGFLASFFHSLFHFNRPLGSLSTGKAETRDPTPTGRKGCIANFFL
jgi:hypothetical protein